jgi:hypothetical protein
MSRPIRPDVHARFVALVARADAKIRSEQQATRRQLSAAAASKAGGHKARDPEDAAV